jgi:hypothetical protein
MGAQLNADPAPLAPLVKNKKRDFWVLALLFFFRIFDFSLL